MNSVFWPNQARQLCVKWRSILLPLAIGIYLLFAALFPLYQMISYGIFHSSHEDSRYVVLAEHFFRAFSAGVFYPRWLPDLNGGFGYPTFVFYQPGFFFLHLPFRFVFSDAISSMHGAIYALLLIGGAGAYFIGTTISNRVGGVFAAAMFLLTPYVYVNLFVRGDLSELMAMLLTPWPLFFALALSKRVNEENAPAAGYTIGLAASTTVLIYSHPLTSLIFALILGLFCLGLTWMAPTREQGRRFLVYALSAGVLTLVLSSPYWLTVFLMKDLVNLGAVTNGYFTATNHVVAPWQFFSLYWGFGVSVAGDNDGMSFQLGTLHFVAAVAGLIVGWKNRVVRMAFVLYLALVLSMTGLAIRFWELPVVKFVQFPWRILSVTAVLQVMCMSAVGGLHPSRKVLVPIGLALTIAATVWVHGAQFQLQVLATDVSYENVDKAIDYEKTLFYTHTVKDEFRPLTASLISSMPRMTAGELLLAVGGDATPLPNNQPHNILFRVESDQNFRVILSQFYFPGWRIEVDGELVSDKLLQNEMEENGLIGLPLNAGTHEIKAWYDSPPGNNLRFIIAIILSGFVLAGIVIFDRKSLN